MRLTFSKSEQSRGGALPLIAALIIGACLAGAAAEAQDKVVQIRLSNRHVSEILPLTKPLVTPGGFISADQRTNSLIVIDHPDAIARIRRLVQKLDKAVPLLKIRVRYANQDLARDREASASARGEVGDATVSVGPEPVAGEGVAARLEESSERVTRQSEYVIRVRSGSTAFLETGYDVPHRERWRRLSSQYGYVPETVVFQRVASGYNIRPVLVGEQVRIEIVPRINYFDNRGRDQKIHFVEAATSLTAPLGEWIEIGGILGGHREINRQILSDSRHAADQHLSIRMMVTID
jgi:hypothetical protein